ncbi:MAG: anti-sigma factor [Candidatus Pseudomonas phytovorans]|uniref:Anti-sigma factor n=1 Tax=Candidatus Pseudomonas phytovorans TaxID=3121377 RepID=A0AAJ5WNM4_9PSED|nr:anti-sigma factor [Pseudomonas sp.]WEK32942.1 MAG: anti-sigma factor [Pseudomonas sp.]
MNEYGLPPNDDRDLLIAEYVLGVLTREENAHVEALAARDAAVQGAVAAWQRQFAGWLAQMPQVQPPASVWQLIEQQLFSNARPVDQPRWHWWSSVGFWRWSSAGLAAALIAAILILSVPERTITTPMLARLEQNDGNVLFTATVQPESREVLFVPTRTSFWTDQSAQAWLIGKDGRPHSLGLLPTNAAAALAIPTELAASLSDGAVLAVSLEPENGSPTGLPTGPVIAQGKISSL